MVFILPGPLEVFQGFTAANLYSVSVEIHDSTDEVHSQESVQMSPDLE